MEKVVFEIPEEVEREIKEDLGFENPSDFVKSFFLIFLDIKGLGNLEFTKWIKSEKEKISPSAFFSCLLRHAAKLIDSGVMDE